MIDTEGAVVGQVNGLSVYDMGQFMFGKPSRITARTSMGRAGVINIEREAELSGRDPQQGRPHPGRLPPGEVRPGQAARP